MPAPLTTWSVVVPVKRLGTAKSRLVEHPVAARADLALAFAADAVAAALGCALVHEVVVVTADERASRALRALGARVLDEAGAGLDAAVRRGAAHVRESRSCAAVAALTADLPALRPADLGAVLAAAQAPCSVPDAEGTGTTLLAAPPGHRLRPRFGEGSAARHAADGMGHVAAAPGLRRDVDTASDLVEALRLGVGPATAEVARRLGLALPR